MVLKVCIGMSTAKIHILQFKIQGHLHKGLSFNVGIPKRVLKKNRLSKFPKITFIILEFSLKSIELDCHPEYLVVYFSGCSY